MSEIIIKPYEPRYRNGVVDVLQYLWKFSEKERYERFDWLYGSNTNPSFDKILAVVAVNENDEVLGFRGWVPGIVWQNGEKYILARAADVVVSPKGRRQGIFSKMTTYSLDYLKNNGISGILNLSSNSQSNPGYIKLGWKPLRQLNIWYKIRFSPYLRLSEKEEFVYDSHKVVLYPYIPKGLKIKPDDSLCFSMNEGQLDWYADRPNKEYVSAVSYSPDGEISSAFIIDAREKVYGLIYFYSKDRKVGIYTFRKLCKRVRSRVIAVWGCALTADNTTLLHKLRFVQIPFYEKIRQIPPILVRSLDTEEKKGWSIGDKDMRNINNWNINLIDDF